MSVLCEGSPDADIMVISSSPSKVDLNQDRPLAGTEGKVFWALAKKAAGIDRGNCYVINVIGEPAAKDGDAVTADQLDRYWDAFDSAASNFRGRVVLLLGGAALSRYCGVSGGINQWRGYIIRPSGTERLERVGKIAVPYKTNGKGHKKGDLRWVKAVTHPFSPLGKHVQVIIPTVTPGAVIRTGFLAAPLLAADLAKAGRALRAELKPSRSHYEVTPIIFGRGKSVAVDIETGTADGDFRDITRVGFASADTAWTRQWDSSTAAATRAVLADPDRIVIIHNAGFDSPRLAAAGCPIRGSIRDSMLAAAFLAPDDLKGLNACGATYLDCERWKHLGETDPAKYNALDAIREFELWHEERRLLEERGQLTLFEGTICRALPALFDMSELGIRVDAERKSAWITELEDKAVAQLGNWSAATGGCNLNSPAQLKKYFKTLGMDLRLNRFGAESVDKLSLINLRADYPEKAPLLDLLMATRHTLKELETYAKTPVSGDGRIRASFVPAYKDEDGLGKGLAGTWRITAKEPNLQNQPKEARRIYIPDEGMVLVGADYSQLEARILAALSGDDVLQAACEAGIHQRNADLLGVDKTRAKNGFYGWGYLAGPRTLYNTFKQQGFSVSQKECESLLEGFNTLYAKAAGFRTQALALAKSKRYVENPFGFRRYFPQRDFPAPSAMSTLIQSTGAFMMWSILPDLAAAAKSFGGNLLLTVHDDVMWQVPKEHKVPAMEAIQEIMQREFPMVAPGFRCPATKKFSPYSWGEMEDVK